MAVTNSNNPTLLDLAKLTGPTGAIMDVVEILHETSEMLTDMTWQEGNLATGHRESVRTGIPAPTWRKIGGGVQPNKSTTAQITFDTGMLEAYAEVDQALADLNGNTPAFRLKEDSAFIEGMNQEIQDTLIFGNSTTEPEAFTGFAPYYNSLSTGSSAVASSDNVIDGGGSGSDNASIWLVIWAPTTIFGITPKGSQAGLKMTDKGIVTIQDASNGSNSGRMEAYMTHYKWDAGLVIRDWRYAVRIANIDKSLLLKDAASGPDLPDLMFQALDLIPNLNRGRAAFYMARDLRTWVRRQQAAAVSGSTLEIGNVGGVRTLFFQEVPMRRVDALSADESAVT